MTEILKRDVLLKEMEEMAIEGAGKIISGATEVGIALHKIFIDKLYLEHKDEKGLPLYKNQSEYEPYILQQMGISRASLYNYYTPVKIACGPTLQLSYDEYTETGGQPLWSKIKEELEYDTKGEVKALTHLDLPVEEIKPFIMDHVKDLSPGDIQELNLSPAQVKQEVIERFSGGKKASITYRLKEDEEFIQHIEYCIKNGMEQYIEYLAEYSSLPEKVKKDLKRRLHIQE